MRLVKASIVVAGIVAIGAGVPLAATPAGLSEAEHGKRIFIRCAACHAISATAPNKVGPHLAGVVGRKSGSVEGYTYSAAMQAANLRWDEPTLDRWLTRPSSVVPGTAMVFAGLPEATDRKAVIAYLKKPVP